MNNLEYDSLHKFLVSLGIIFLASPLVILYFFLKNDVLLITKNEFNELSAFSKKQLFEYQEVLTIVRIILPIICLIFFFFGIILLIKGLKNWQKVQVNLDKLIEQNKDKQALELEKMKPVEIFKQTLKEINEENKINTNTDTKILEYINMEEIFFTKFLPLKIKRDYYLERNVKIDKFTYDAIAISKTNNIDLIYEVKYSKNIFDTKKFKYIIERLYEKGLKYENLTHRNFKCLLVIIVSKDHLENLQKRGEQILKNLTFHSKVTIQYINLEDLLAKKIN